MIDTITPLPKDLGPEAIGLSRELVKQCQTEESIDVSHLCDIVISQYSFTFNAITASPET